MLPSIRLSPSPPSCLPPALCPVRAKSSHSWWSPREPSSRSRAAAEMTSRLWIRSSAPSSKTRALPRPLRQWIPVTTQTPPRLLLGRLPPRPVQLWYPRLICPSPLGCKVLWAPQPPQGRESPQQDMHRLPHPNLEHRLGLPLALVGKCI